jgi:CRP/FNR family transcriptional regulator
MVSGESLRAFPILQDLSSAELALLDGAIQEHCYRTRAVIFEAGQSCTALHLVRSGRVQLYQAGPGKLHILALPGAGDILDATPLLDGGPHIVTARAKYPVALYEIERDATQTLLERSSTLRLAMLRLVAEQLRAYATHVNDLAFKQVPARLAGVLLDYARPDGIVALHQETASRRLNKEELAALVGTAREVVVRALKRLEGQGLIALQPNQILVLDRAGLKRMHESG